MTEQEELQYLFDTSLNHIRQQGKPSVIEHDVEGLVCAYKSNDGCGCGAAPFIIAYDPNMETLKFEQICFGFSSNVDEVAKRRAPFVDRLQAAHDSAAIDMSNGFIIRPLSEFKETYEKGMKGIAVYHGLVYNAP